MSNMEILHAKQSAHRIFQNGEVLKTVTGESVTIKDHFIDDTFFGNVVYEVIEDDTWYLFGDFEESYEKIM